MYFCKSSFIGPQLQPPFAYCPQLLFEMTRLRGGNRDLLAPRGQKYLLGRSPQKRRLILLWVPITSHLLGSQEPPANGWWRGSQGSPDWPPPLCPTQSRHALTLLVTGAGHLTRGARGVGTRPPCPPQAEDARTWEGGPAVLLLQGPAMPLCPLLNGLAPSPQDNVLWTFFFSHHGAQVSRLCLPLQAVSPPTPGGSQPPPLASFLLLGPLSHCSRAHFSGVAQDITQLNEECGILEISTHTLLGKNTLTFKKGIIASFSSDLMY